MPNTITSPVKWNEDFASDKCFFCGCENDGDWCEEDEDAVCCDCSGTWEFDEEEDVYNANDGDGEYQRNDYLGGDEAWIPAYRVYFGDKAYMVYLPTEEKFFTTEQKAKDYIDEVNSTASIDVFTQHFCSIHRKTYDIGERPEENLYGYDIIDKNWYAD